MTETRSTTAQVEKSVERQLARVYERGVTDAVRQWQAQRTNWPRALSVGPGAFGLSMMSGGDDRRSRYDQYEKLLEIHPPLAQALLGRSSMAVIPEHQSDNAIVFESESDEVQDILGEMATRIKLAHRLPQSLFETHKCGDYFGFILTDGRQVIDFPRLDPRNVDVLQDGWRRVGYRVRRDGDISGSGIDIPLWAIAHVRVTIDQPYGRSLLHYGRRHGKMKQWMDHSMVLKRVYYSMDRMVKKIPINDDANEEDEDAAIKRYRARDKLHPYLDDNALYNQYGAAGGSPLALLEPEYFPVAPNDSEHVGVQYFSGSASLDQIADVEKVGDELLSLTGYPKRYLGIGDDAGARASLDVQDRQLVRLVLFDQVLARTQAIEPLADIELALKGINPRDPKNAYHVRLAPLNIDDQKMLAEVEFTKAKEYKLLLSDGWPARVAIEKIYGAELDEESVDAIEKNAKALADIKALADQEQATMAAIFASNPRQEAARIAEASRQRLAAKGIKRTATDVLMEIEQMRVTAA